MIILTAQRQYAECTREMFQLINNLKRTHLKNIAHLSKSSGEYLTAILLHGLFDEVELIIKKKLINCQAKKLTFKFTNAQGVAFYKALLELPIPSEHVWYNHVRNTWVQELDQQILKTTLAV